MGRAIAILLVLVAGCTSSGGSGRPARQVVVGWADKGRTIRLQLHDSLVVRLDSTYWRFGPKAPGVLSAGHTVVHGGKSAYPGSGNGTVVATYQALQTGTATVTAGRTSCGEALRCVDGQSSYRLTVVVG